MGFPELYIVDNLQKNPKREDLIIKQKVQPYNDSNFKEVVYRLITSHGYVIQVNLNTKLYKFNHDLTG